MLSWWARHRDKCNQCIFSFDMSNELFLTTTLPDNSAIGYRHYSQRRFFLLNELVSLVIFIEDIEWSESFFFHIWSLLEFGVSKSWIKLFTIGPPMGIEKPLGFLKNDSMFLENNEGKLLLYNLSTKEMTNLQVGGEPKSLQMITYVESLISVKGENDYEDQDFS